MSSSSSSSSSLWSKMKGHVDRLNDSWSSSSRNKSTVIDPEDINSITTLQDCCIVLKRAVELRRGAHSIQAMNTTARIINEECHKLSININNDDNPITTEIGNLGICSYIDQILGSSLSQADVCESSLRLIVLLISSCSSNRLKFATAGCSYRIVKVMQLHASDAKLMEMAIDIVRYLSLEDDVVSKLVGCGICEVLCQVLKSHTAHDKIVELTCRCIYNITYDNDDSKEKFANAGICEILIVRIMDERRSNIDITVAKWSLRAIGGLGRRHDQNIRKLTDVGTCELVVHSLLHFKNEFDSGSSQLSKELVEELAEAGSWAIASLAFPNTENQSRFASLGAVDLILGYLQEYIQNASLVRESLRAIRSLGHEHAVNLKLIHEKAGCEAVVAVIRAHNSDFETVQWGWFAVATLSSDESSLSSWGAAGACDQIVGTLTRFWGNSDVVLWACMALSKLAVDAENCASVGQIDGGKLHVAIMRAMMAHADKVDILEEICCATSVLAVNEKNSSRLIDTGCANVILAALKKHSASEAVAHQGLKSVRQFMVGGDIKIIAKIVAENACSIVPKTLNKLYSNMFVSLYAIEVIGILAYSDVNREKLLSNSVTNGLIEAMMLHMMNADLVLSGLRAVSQMCLCNAAGVKVSSSNYFAVLVKVLRMILRTSSDDNSNDVDTRRVILELCMSSIRDQASYPGLSAKFINEGCVEIMVGILQHYMADLAIVSSVCLTFSTLAGSNKKTLLMDSAPLDVSIVDKIGSAGACEIIVKALVVHAESIQVVIPCLDAIHSLAITSANRQRFGSAGGPSAVMRGFQIHGKTMGIIEIVCSAIGSLAMSDDVSSSSSQTALGESGACEAMNEVLVSCQDSAMVCEAACRAISCLADCHEMNQNKFADLGTCTIVFNVLTKFSSSNSTTVQALLAVSSLGNGHDENSRCFGSLMIANDVFGIFNKNPSDVSIIEACCRVMCSLKSLMLSFGVIGFCGILGSALNLHNKKESAALWICKAISTLAHMHKNRMALSKQGACEAVTATIKAYASNESIISVVMMRNTGSTAVTQWACEALYFLMIDPTKISVDGEYLESSESDAVLEDFQKAALQAGACDAVSKALSKYGEIESVSYSCCRAVWALCYGSEATQAKFGSLGVCSYITETLQMFPSSMLVARWGCRAVGLIAKNNEANVNRLLTAGICEILPSTMQSHQTNAAVAESCCEAIANLSSSASQSLLARLGQSGACESIVGALQKHSVSNGLVLSACHAIANLSVTKGNASWLGATGACETMLKSVLLHSSEQLTCAIAWKAVGNLCSDDDNRFRLGNIGTCEATLESMIKHSQSIDINNWGAYAIARLIERESSPVPGADTNGRSNSPVNIELPVSNVSKLSSSGCSEVLVAALTKHSHNQAAAYNICQAIAVLARSGGLLESEKMGRFGACNAVVVAMKQHGDKENVSWSGACALRSLSVNNYASQEKIGEVGGCAVLAQLLVRHKSSNDAVEAASAAISNICASDISYNKEQLGEAGACEHLLCVLELYQKNAETTLWITSALEQLCYNNEANMRKVAFSSNCGDLLVSVLQRFMDKEIFPNIICSLMIELCSDRVGHHKLSSAGACKAVVNLLLRGAIGGVGGVMEQRSDVVVKLIMILFGALCSRSPENQNKLGQLGACKAVCSILEKHLNGAMSSVSYFTEGASAVSPAVQTTNDSMTTKLTKKVTDIVTKRMSMIVSEAMRAVSSSDSLDSIDYVSTATGRYVVVLETCNAIVALTQDNPTNRIKIVSTGISDLMTSFINGGYGFIQDDTDKGDKLRKTIADTLVCLQADVAQG